MLRFLEIGLVLAAVAAAVSARADSSGGSGSQAPRRIVWIGASISHGWNLPEFPSRAGMEGLALEFVGVYQFDKTAAVEQALSRPGELPAAVVVKECAAYFPGDLESYKQRMKGWIDACRRAGTMPIPATVCPLAPSGAWQSLKDWIKTGVLGKPDRREQIREFNDWLRGVASEEGLPLLDLEAELRVSESDRSLRPGLDSGDGLHLNKEAYAMLDAALARFLSTLPATGTVEEGSR